MTYEEPKPLSLRHLIGLNVAALRGHYGIRQQDLAREMRHLGIKWAPSTVASLEAGDKAVTIEALLLLANALNTLTDDAVGLADLVGDPQRRAYVAAGLSPTGEVQVALTDAVRVTADELARFFAGPRVDMERGADVADTAGSRVYAVISKNLDYYDRLLGDYAHSPELFGNLLESGGEAERFQARKLGVPREDVLCAAIGLWGRSLTAERDARLENAGPTPSVNTKRGHVTRELAQQVRERLEAAARGELPESKEA